MFRRSNVVCKSRRRTRRNLDGCERYSGEKIVTAAQSTRLSDGLNELRDVFFMAEDMPRRVKAEVLVFLLQLRNSKPAGVLGAPRAKYFTLRGHSDC